MRRLAALAGIALLLLSLAPGAVAAGEQRARMVVGFLPYWTASSFSPEGWGLTDIVFFDAPVRRDGTLDLSRVEAHLSDIQRIREECGGCRIHLAVTIFDKDLADEVLAYHRIELAYSIRSAVIQYGFDGVNIDFEFIRDTNSITGEDNTLLMVDLIQRIRGSTSIIVGLDIAGSIETVWRDTRIADVVDYVFLMGYDFHYAGSSTTGSVSPLTGPGLSLEWAIDKLLQYYPPSKIVLGLPLYGYDWPAQSCAPGAKTLSRGTARTLAKIENELLPIAQQHWDPEAASPWLSYWSSGQCRQVWYENATSIAIKADYALRRGLAGFGFWALGYTSNAPSEPGIMALTRSRLVTPSVGAVTVESNGSRITVRIADAAAVSLVRITMILNRTVTAVTFQEGTGLEGLGDVQVTRQGNTVTVTARADEPVPGAGMWGTGVLVTLALPEPVRVLNASVEAMSYRLLPDRSLDTVAASVGEVNIVSPEPVEPPPSQPPGRGVGGEQGRLEDAPISRPGDTPSLSASMVALVAVLAAFAIAAFFAIARVLF